MEKQPKNPAYSIGGAEYRREQTSLEPGRDVTILQSSEGLGWTEVYAALTDERPHQAIHRAVPDIWFATTFSGVQLSRTSKSLRHQETVPANRVSIAAPGEAISDEIGVPVKALHVYLKSDVVVEVANELFKTQRSSRTILPVFATGDPSLVLVLQAIGAALSEPAGSSTLKMEYLARALAAHVLQWHSTEGTLLQTARKPPALSAKQLQLVLSYVEDNLEREILVKDLASLLNLSPVQFMRRFKTSQGTTVHQSVMLARVRKAKELLRDQMFGLADIAAICGFSNPGHFASVFKRFVNTSPGEYRRAIS